MRYYSEGDEIYVFGFSRGAYTARFLCEMLYTIGLLSRGNEEMVRFAWNTFSDYQRTRGNVPQTKKDIEHVEYMKKFRKTFCRPKVEIRFLGLFDCVNSVGQFEVPLGQKNYNVIAEPPATHIRHAISIHERRLKFKPALFHVDGNGPSDVKEMWFAGNHGDVGGGWGFQEDQRYLLSDTPLEWMINEVKSLPDCNLKWSERPVVQQEGPKELKKRGFWGWLFAKKRSEHQIRVETMQPHDMLAFGRGASWFGTLSWWILGRSFLAFIGLLLTLQKFSPSFHVLSSRRANGCLGTCHPTLALSGIFHSKRTSTPLLKPCIELASCPKTRCPCLEALILQFQPFPMPPLSSRHVPDSEGCRQRRAKIPQISHHSPTIGTTSDLWRHVNGDLTRTEAKYYLDWGHNEEVGGEDGESCTGTIASWKCLRCSGVYVCTWASGQREPGLPLAVFHATMACSIPPVITIIWALDTIVVLKRFK
jgi:hypothetical protein